MKFPLKSDWKSRINEKNVKIYPLEIRDKKVIDRIFDEFYKQGRFIWITQSTFFNYFIFVIWKNVSDDERKDCSIINIHNFNDLLIRNAYSVPLQSNVIVNFRKCIHISIFDVFSFFYQ